MGQGAPQQMGQGVPPQQMGGQPPQQQEEDWNVDTSGFEDVAEDVLQDAIDRYYDEGYTPEQAQQALAQEAQAGRFYFSDLESKHEYDSNLGQLEQALADEYGKDGAVDVFKQLYQNIHAKGGDALLHKFMTDPEMLDPEIVQGYLGETEGAENPYSQFIRQNASRVNPSMGPGLPPGQAPQQGPVSMDQIKQEEAQIYSRIHQGDPADGNRLVQLGIMKRQMAAQQQGGGMIPGL